MIYLSIVIFNNGEKDLFQAWTKWQLPGNIQTFSVINDMMFIVTEQQNQYTLGVISLEWHSHRYSI